MGDTAGQRPASANDVPGVVHSFNRRRGFGFIRADNAGPERRTLSVFGESSHGGNPLHRFSFSTTKLLSSCAMKT